MTGERRFFSELREDREWYFVEYKPPLSYRFATLNLVVPETVSTGQIADAMEAELKLWLGRYPVPLFVSAFDSKGDLCDLAGVRASNHVMGLRSRANQEVQLHWRLLSNEEIPDDALDPAYLEKVYAGVPYKTRDDVRRESAEQRRRVRIGWAMVFVWAVIVPAVVAIFEWASPPWVAVLVLAYSLWKATVKALKMLGKWKKSPRELREEEEDRRMRHHHYHCEKNPDGFLRLKLENFEREEQERIRNEAVALKSKKAD